MVALDTSLLVRLLTNDDATQALQVREWLQAHSSARQPAYIDHLVLAELSWVLARSYGYAREQVHLALSSVLRVDAFVIEQSGQVRQALQWYAAGPGDFADYLLAARAHAAGYAPVLTLDRKAARSPTHQLLA